MHIQSRPSRLGILIGCFLFVTGPAPALEMEKARDYLGMEYAHCANWFLIMREVAARSFPPGLDRNLAIAQQEELAQKAFDRSAEATSREIALERSKASMTAMMGRMRNSLDNLPAIADEYAYSCKALMDSPEGRLQFWLEQK